MRRSLLTTLVLFVILWVVLPLQAAMSDYTFAQTPAAYQEIAGGTQIHGPAVDDAMSAVIDIGFTFVLDDVAYTQFKANSNGFITLNAASTASLTNALATQILILGGMWDDLKTGTNGNVTYQLTGAAPNRSLIVQFKEMQWYYSVTTNFINFQIVLRETSNLVEYFYGTMGNAPGTSASASIGISGATAGNYISITPASPTATYSTTTEFNQINGTHVDFLTGNKYTFSPPVAVPNDLQAISLTGNTTPSAGAASPYTVTVRNRGSAAQSNYSVKLMSGTTELATVAGPAIAAGQVLPVIVNWTPATAGPIQIFGKVVLTGDQNPANDNTAPMNITVMPAGTIVVTIGDGSQNARKPIDFYYKNSLFQTIYQASEFTAGGVMTDITFYNNFTTNLTDKPTKIWLGLTDQTDLSAGWIPSTQLTLVYDGLVTYPSGPNNIIITLQTPFPFAGGNLVMMVNRPMDTQFFSSADNFLCQTVGTNRSRNVQSDGTLYDPANPPTTSTLSGQFPKTSFSFVAAGTNPQFAISPQSHDFGQKIINTTSTRSFNIMNVGGGTTPLVINSITITGSPFFTLQNLPTLPVSLTSGQSASFVVSYTPTAAGTHTATVTVTDNLTRTQHLVQITASCLDPQIYTSPYFQDFNSVTVPNLPLDWNRLQISPAYANTSTTTPYSAPNSVYLYSNTPANGPYLIAPPVAPILPLTTMRTRFRARGTAATYVLSVGVMSDPTDAATYTEVTTINMTTTWTEYVVGFQTYTGQGRFITFKPGGTGTYQYIYIDDVTIELISDNDLAALSITGNSIPSVGAASNYTVNVFNWGTVSQSNYTVKLYNGNNVELASVPGITVAPGMAQPVVISWTPTVAGPMSIYGKVILTGDQNSMNDQTPNLNLFVQAAGTIVVTVGDGNQTSYQMPVNMYYKSSVYQNIYFADQMTAGGVMTAVSFYNNFLTNLPNKPTKVWLAITNNQDLSAGWISSNDMTLVFDGNVDYPSGQNTIIVPFDTPFPYAGGNLVMMVFRPLDTQYFSTSDLFYTQTAGTNRARYINSDTVVYDTAAMTGGTLTGMYPKTSFFFTAAGTTPQFAISPQSFNFGEKLINTISTKSFNIMNVGGGTTPLIISSIAITGSPFFTLQNLPTLPASLNTGQTATFNVQYAPTAAGAHSATVTITDNMARTYTYDVSRSSNTRTQHPLPVSATAIDVTIYSLPYAQNFDTVAVPNLPLDWNSLVVQTGTAGYVRTVTTAPQSTPNCISIYNGTDANAQLMLIAPPLVNTIPINTSRLRVWIKGGGTGYTVQIGVMSDISDAASFTLVETITPTTTWAEYVVGLQTYAGTGRYIAIKHGMGGTGRTIYVDTAMIEIIADNDLAGLSLAGNSTPSVGSSFTYTLAVSNWGLNPQSNYQVKLFDSNHVELASAPGPMVNPGMTVDATVAWTPTTQGAMSIYGRVVLNGDQNPLNDVTPSINIFVYPAGTLFATIGTGTTTQRQPMGILYGYERDASLYTQEQIGLVGAITGVQWYCATTATATVPYKIYMKTTTETAFTAQPWATMIADATLLAEGTQVFNQAGWVYFPFTVPFIYPGGNLVVIVETYYGGSGTSTPYFRYTSSTTASHQYWYADTTPPAGNGYLNALRPNIGMSFTSIGNDPAFAISPASFNYGQTFVNLVHNKTFTIVNIGGGTNPLIINNITISGSPFFTLQNLPTFPVSLAGFQTTNFVARYNPTAPGEHTATITITDNLARTYTYGVSRDNRDMNRTQHLVPLTGTCIDPTIYTSPYTQNFDTVTIPNLPIDWSKFTVSPGNVTTVTTTPQSAPNCVFLSNSTSTNGPYLISPPIANTLPLNTMRIKFWARGVGAYLLSVGAMTNPLDAATYTQVSSMTLTTTWTEYVVGFQTYAGTGQYMAIKHGNAATSQSIYIDGVTIEVIPQNDLAAVSLSGNQTPSVGMATPYTVNLFNWGTQVQNNYTVKLFKQGDIELGSVPGPTIQPGMAGTAVVSWVPSVQENTFIYGKVVLTGDQNPLNDQTPNLNVAVMPAGMMVVTIGDGSQTARLPMDFYWKNSLFETVYQQSELNFIGMITGVSFYNNFTTNLPAKPTKIWLGTTTQTDLSAGWIPSTDMTLVYDGTVDYPSGPNTITIPFIEPFLYLEGNLVMMVNRPMDTQYFSSTDNFYTQTVGTNRSRNVQSDGTLYDPALPPTTSTLSGQFPKTSFMVIPGGVGHLTGYVYGAGNQPLNNATIQLVGGGQATTNAQGYYMLQNIIAGDYQVTASRYGYISQTLNIEIPEDSTVTQNFTLQQMPTVSVTGRIVGSDAPTVGLAGASIALTGYENYQVTANAQGQFTIEGVYTNQTYQYSATAVGYQNTTGSVTVGTTNHNMGDISVSEIAYTPRNVNAVQAGNQMSVTLNWTAPDPTAVDIDQSFESDTFPPTDWTRIVTNNGPANTAGVFPTWCRFGTVTSGTHTVIPSNGSWQAGFWWDYNHQDEWLISPQFNCPQGAVLTFDTYAFYGSPNNDHYYVKVSNNNGSSWTVLWDAAALTGGWNVYQNPVTINLNDYAGQQIKLAWHADDPNSTSDGMWYNWFIDNVVISNAGREIRFAAEEMTVKSASGRDELPLNVVTSLPMSRDNGLYESTLTVSMQTEKPVTPNTKNNRALVGYRVWRLSQGQEQNEAVWTSLTPNVITATTITDNGWAVLAAGTYKWAVKAVYTNNVLSLAAFSNAVVKNPVPTGTLTGYVRNVANQAIAGAVINVGGITATTIANGTYTMQVPAGTHAVTCTATGYQAMTYENIVVNANQTTACNFIMSVSNDDMIQVTQTALKGNYPNPFNPETTISFDIKDRVPVRLEIFNTKGQLIRTLVSDVYDKGHHQVIWNGKDNNGNSVASGVYNYRMTAGEYKAIRRMMLMK